MVMGASVVQASPEIFAQPSIHQRNTIGMIPTDEAVDVECGGGLNLPTVLRGSGKCKFATDGTQMATGDSVAVGQPASSVLQ